jgi:hypothetical protein
MSRQKNAKQFSEDDATYLPNFLQAYEKQNYIGTSFIDLLITPCKSYQKKGVAVILVPEVGSKNFLSGEVE